MLGESTGTLHMRYVVFSPFGAGEVLAISPTILQCTLKCERGDETGCSIIVLLEYK